MTADSAPSFRLLPVEATEAMRDAARDWSLAKYGQGIGNDAANGAWSVMVSAAPVLGEATGWQPIETAPKDGRRVLLWMVHANRKWGPADEWEAPVVAYWMPHNGGGWVWHGMAGVPTAWRPAPDPPSINAALAIAAGQLGEKESGE